MSKISLFAMMVALSLTLTLNTDASVRLASTTHDWNTGSSRRGGEVPSAHDEVINAGGLASGTCVYRLQAQDKSEMKRMHLVR